ncbi:MAG: M56 family metallopeptidase, partial [Clostridia bacterium]|nr:M56 family metallopeptidase [Clostridia bacterium]
TPDTETILQNEIPSPETDEIISSHDSESTNETDVGINAGIDNDTIDSTEDISPTPPAIPETAPVVNTDNKAHKIEAEKALYFIWGAGAAAMSLWFFISWLLFTFKLWNTDVFHSEFNGIKVYISDKIASPCVAGVKPIIYITPEAAESENLSYVLAHEYTHLHHGDRVWSAVRVIATCVFWWNPLVWATAFLSKSDAELACDESVIKGFNEGDRLAYANSIVDMIPKRSNYAIGFGNGSIKERIVMLTTTKPKKILISAIAIIVAIACAGCAYTAPKPAKNPSENKVTSTDLGSEETTKTEPEEQTNKGELTEEEIEKYTNYKTMYYFSTFGYKFETNDTVPVDNLMDFFLFNEFMDGNYGEDNDKYSKYSTDQTDPMAYHLIPVEIVNDWLEEHFAVKVDHNNSRYLDGNGNYKIAEGGRGGPVGKILNISKEDNGIVIIDILGGDDIGSMYNDYLQIAIKETENDYKYLYCRDNTPKTNINPEKAVEILKDALEHPNDAIFSIEHNTVTPIELNDEIYCSIMPYVTSGDPEDMPENTYYRANSTPLYVSLDSGKIYKAIYDLQYPSPKDFVEYNTNDIDISTNAQTAMETVKNIYKDSKNINTVECELPLYELNDAHYYKVNVYLFDENDPFNAYENGYIPTERSIYYVGVTDGKIYDLKYEVDENYNYSYYMEEYK